MSIGNNSGRLFSVAFRTVEYFSILLVAALWLFTVADTEWGDKYHYRDLLNASLPMMIVVGASALMTWRRYRRDSLRHLAVLVGWVIWAALPRL
jgi:hypothetical protein